MKRYVMSVVVLAVLAIASLSLAQNDTGNKPKPSMATTDSAHVMLTPNELKWGPAPPSLPAGAQIAVIDGDPSKKGAPFAVRLKVPDGYRVPPHWHPTDESVTVIEGTLFIGLGDKFDESAGRELAVGSYARMPHGVRHYAWSKGDSVIQVQGTGPLEIVYVNPADDPRHKPGSK